MRIVLFTLLSLACSLALAATVYKWVDDDGVVHYSDQPHPNAQKLQVHDVQTYRPSAGDTAVAAAPGVPVTPVAAGDTQRNYQGCAVVQPADNQDFANLDALNIVVQTDPVLRPGDQIYVSVDGAPLNNGQPTGGQLTLSPVDRGSHTIQAQVRGSDGAVRCQTPSITFSVHQPSLLNPANPLRPR
jgi:hypothetical protein